MPPASVKGCRGAATRAALDRFEKYILVNCLQAGVVHPAGLGYVFVTSGTIHVVSGCFGKEVKCCAGEITEMVFKVCFGLFVFYAFWRFCFCFGFFADGCHSI